MSRSNKRWIALLVGVVGLATGELVWAPAGIALTFVGLFLAFGSVGSFNVFATRLVYGVVALLHGVSVARASGSWVLGAAAFVGPFFLPPMESTNRWLGYSSTWLMAAGPIGAVALGLAAWPPSWWHLALLPTLLPSTFFSVMVGRGMLEMYTAARRIKLKVGDAVPDFTLPARLGRGDVQLSSFRGQHVLLCLLRGDWCPVCQVMMRILAKDAKRLADRNVQVIAVSPTEGADADEMARLLGAEYLVVCDPACTIAQHFGAVEANIPEPGKSTNLPAMVLVDPQGRLAWISTASDVTSHDPSQALRFIDAAPLTPQGA